MFTAKNGHGRAPTLVAAYLMKTKKFLVKEEVDFIRKKGRPFIWNTARKSFRKI